jgi:metallo-beta-lactamase class B
VPLIRSSIEKLRFKFTDVKILLISHAHSDHCAGSAEIIKQTKAQYFVMEQDADAVENGGERKSRLKASYLQFTPAKVDRRLKDGDEVKLGGSTVIANLTPGHTRGCTTWTMKVDGLQAVIIGSPNVNPGYILVGNKDYPGHRHRLREDLPLSQSTARRSFPRGSRRLLQHECEAPASRH